MVKINQKQHVTKKGVVKRNPPKQNKYGLKKVKRDYMDVDGDYYIGDPGYVLDLDENNRDFWSKYVDFIFDKNPNGYDGIISVKGYEMFSFGTAYGDGLYSLEIDGSHAADLGVDSGSLAVIPMKLIHALGNKSPELYLGKKIKLNTRLYPNLEHKGHLRATGSNINIEIDTRDE